MSAKVLSLLVVWLVAGLLRAEVITMDLHSATDMAMQPISYSTEAGDAYYDCTDVWDSTYNDGSWCQWIYANDARFKLSHMPSQNSYGGGSWEGFTLSRVSQDTANVFGCVANGGTGGVGTPYVIGYYSSWVTQAQGYSSNTVLFDTAYYPEYVYICQNSNTREAITNGGVFNSRKFTDKDTLALVIGGLDSALEEVATMTYYMAVDGEKNEGWVKVPLTDLGKVSGLSFRMWTTDIGEWGENTPLYFAMDALTVNTEMPTSLHTTTATSMQQVRKMVVDSRMLIVRDGVVHTMMGHTVE